MNTAQPQRKHLRRIPVWLPAEAPVVYFVTACCSGREPVFTNPSAAQIAVECLCRTERRQRWKIWGVCVMPDHVHFLASPQSDRDQPLTKFMQAWKSCVSLRLAKPVWQREFFDRLLRTEEKWEEKWRYIQENPVRARLCERPEDYPYSGKPEEILERLNVTARRETPETTRGLRALQMDDER